MEAWAWTLHLGIENSTKAILACHPALSTELLGWEAVFYRRPSSGHSHIQKGSLLHVWPLCRASPVHTMGTRQALDRWASAGHPMLTAAVDCVVDLGRTVTHAFLSMTDIWPIHGPKFWSQKKHVGPPTPLQAPPAADGHSLRKCPTSLSTKETHLSAPSMHACASWRLLL